MSNKQPIRIIPKLDIKNGLLIKGINLEGLRVLGDPFYFAREYYNQGADEICYLDNVLHYMVQIIYQNLFPKQLKTFIYQYQLAAVLEHIMT